MTTSIRFQHTTLPQKVYFESGAAASNTLTAVKELGASRIMTVASASEHELESSITDGFPVVHKHRDVVMHVPSGTAEKARHAARASDADAIVAVGGGSTTGLAKAVALTTGLPIVCVPTTYAGSEATPIWGLTTNGVKVTGTDPRVLPASIVYDATLTMSLPQEFGIASGLNALAHCVDALWAPLADPINTAFATEGMRSLAFALPGLRSATPTLAVREEMLYSAYASGVAFASAGSGLHHKICHVLGGLFDLPHAATHAVVLPHVLALNAPAARAAEARISSSLGSSNALEGLLQLGRAVDAPTSLADIGMPEQGIGAACEAISRIVPPSNPIDVTASHLRELLRRAWEGDTPR